MAEEKTRKVSKKVRTKRKYTKIEDLQISMKKSLNGAIISAGIFLILGILLVVFPESLLDILRWIIAIMGFAGAFFLVLLELRRGMSVGLTFIAAVLFAIGLIFATQPGAMGIFSIIIGVYFIISALATTGMTYTLKGTPLIFSGIFSFISLVCGILLVINPWGASVSIVMLLGVLMIIHAISFLADILIFRSHLKDISGRLKSVVVEGEEVK